MITQTYNLNLIPDKVPVIVNCSQYDANSRTIEMNIYDGATLFTIPSGTTASVRGTKQDNTGFEYPCTISGSKVSYDIQDQMTLYAGKVPCEIRLADSNGIIGTCNFMLNVEETPLDPQVTISETDLPLLEEAEQNAVRAEQAADRAEQIVGDAVYSVDDILPVDGNVDLSSEFNAKQDKLTAGTGIQLNGATISNVFAYLESPNLNDITYNYQGYVRLATNTPTSITSGVLCVIARDSGQQLLQLFSPYNANTLYMRSFNSSWTAWTEIYSASSLTAGDGINITSGGVISNRFANLADVDLNTVKYNCVVWCNDSCSNLPRNYGGMLLSCFSSNNGSYGTQIFTSYAIRGKGVFYRRYSGETWSDWTELVSQFESTIVPNENHTNCTGTIFLRASGQMVMIDFSTIVKCTTGGSGWVKLFQLPNGFTPVARQKMLCADDSTTSGGLVSVAEAKVDTDGSFSIYNAVTGHNYWGGTMIYLRS